jgi:predicted site-specific integrase-resolvase
MTKRQTAQFFQVSERTIDRWYRDGTLPANAKVVIGGTVRFRVDVITDLTA